MAGQFKAGQLIGGEYRVEAVFGGAQVSGQGVVYLVSHPDAPRPFVLKTFQDDGGPDSAERHRLLIAEAKAWVGIGRHPNC